MFTFAGILFLLIGVAALSRAAVAVVVGRIWRDPNRVKFDPRWRPGRWVERGGDGGQFWLDVVYHLVVGAAAVYFGLRWLLLQRL